MMFTVQDVHKKSFNLSELHDVRSNTIEVDRHTIISVCALTNQDGIQTIIVLSVFVCSTFSEVSLRQAEIRAVNFISTLSAMIESARFLKALASNSLGESWNN